MPDLESLRQLHEIHEIRGNGSVVTGRSLVEDVASPSEHNVVSRREQNTTGKLPVENKVPTSNAGVWNYMNMIYNNNDATSSFNPALVEFGGELYCLWAGINDHIPYCAAGTNTRGSFMPRQSLVADPGIMTNGGALAVLGTELYAVFVNVEYMILYKYTDQIDNNQEIKQWNRVGHVGGAGNSVKTNHQPALLGFGGQLFCCYSDSSSSELQICRWTPPSPPSDGSEPTDPGLWTTPQATGLHSYDCPGLYVFQDQLHVIFVDNGSQKIFDYMWNPDPVNTWTPSFGFEQDEYSAVGCSVTSDGENAFVSFLKNDQSGRVLVCALNYDVTPPKWAVNEFVNQTSANCPAIAILDGVVDCIYSARSNAKDLLLSQRTVYTYPLDSWMSYLDPTTLFSDLSVPGTHDSTARFNYFAQCQSMTIQDQLTAGIRYFDFRLKWTNNNLIFYHGPVSQEISLSQVMGNINSWFAASPASGPGSRAKEVLFIQIGDEDGNTSTDDFRNNVYQTLTGPLGTRWVFNDTVKSIGDLAGKIQLVRRYEETTHYPFGIDVSTWNPNSLYFTITTPSGQLVTVQDYFSVTSNNGWNGVRNAKVKAILGMFQQVLESKAKTGQLFLNWTSAYGNVPYMAPQLLAGGGAIDGIFTGVNSVIRQWYEMGCPVQARLGCVLMDFPEDPEEDLIQAIIQTNVFAK